MDDSAPNTDRRRLLALAAGIGATGVLGLPRTAQADPPAETNRIRLVHDPAICFAPQYLAEELLRLEGFTDIEWVRSPTTAAYMALDAGRADMTMDAIPGLIYGTDRGSRFVTLAGIHAGCYELFGNHLVGHIRDLRGKRIAIYADGGADHVLLSSMLAYVGIKPRTEVEWIVEQSPGESMQNFIDGKADAYLAFAPQPHELRKAQVGRVILNTAEDRPWSQYFCCGLAANQDFVTNHPAATRRAVRAHLKAADICVREPERVARFLVERGYEPRYEVALAVLKSLPYDRWRESNPADTIRFHGLRLYEGGIIRMSPAQLLSKGADFRILNALRRELKS